MSYWRCPRCYAVNTPTMYECHQCLLSAPVQHTTITDSTGGPQFITPLKVKLTPEQAKSRVNKTLKELKDLHEGLQKILDELEEVVS